MCIVRWGGGEVDLRWGEVWWGDVRWGEVIVCHCTWCVTMWCDVMWGEVIVCHCMWCVRSGGGEVDVRWRWGGCEVRRGVVGWCEVLHHMQWHTITSPNLTSPHLTSPPPHLNSHRTYNDPHSPHLTSHHITSPYYNIL